MLNCIDMFGSGGPDPT